MMWQPTDFFQCVNAQCKSKVVVLQSPRSAPGDHEPRCVCGHPLQRVPYGPQEPLRVWTF